MPDALLETDSSLRERAVPVLAELPTTPPGELPLTIIERKSDWHIVDFHELWRYRELLYFLVWRDVKVRYKQTVLGAAWAVLQPLATMVVFSLFFGRVAVLPSGELPYPLFVFAGLLPWTFFSGALNCAGGSVVGSQNLVTKVYFPRLLIPMGAVGAGLVDFAVASGMLSLLMLWFGVAPGPGVVLLPLVALVLVAAALGVGTLFSALTVAYRDFRYVVPFTVQLWMFATPCIYMATSQFEGTRLGWILPLNPAYGTITAFRSLALNQPLNLYAFVVSTAVALVMLLVGCLYFRRVERSFADII